MLVLNRDNYHSRANTAITNSKVGDFLLSKRYYRARHIDGTIPDAPTPSMQLGSAVDCLLFDGLAPFFERFSKGAPEALRPADFVRAQAIADSVKRTEAWLFYAKDTQFQVPLLGTLPRTKISYAGMPDIITRDGDTIFIDDLKTTRNSDCRTPEAWYWKCVRSGYFRQLEVYAHLVAEQYGAAKIITRHLVVGTTEVAGSFPVKLFVIPASLRKPYWKEFCTIAKRITKEKDWTDPPVSWQTAVNLKQPAKLGAMPMEDEE